MFDFIEEKNNQVICKKKLTILIDQDMFDDNIAEIIDDKLSTMGTLTFLVDNGGGKTKEYRLALPITILLNATDIYKDSGYYKIDYEPNDIIIEKALFFLSATIGAKNANGFLGVLTTAKLHVDRPEGLVDLFKLNTKLNGINIGVQNILIEAMVSELCRYRKDNTIPFRIALKNKSVTFKDF